MTRARDVANIDGLLTTTGDTYYASAAGTPARLGIGSTDQVLKVSGGVPTWATPSSGAMTLIRNASFSAVTDTGTTFDGVFTTTYKIYKVAVIVKSSANTTVNFQVRSGTTTRTAAYESLKTLWNGTTETNLSVVTDKVVLGTGYSSVESYFNMDFIAGVSSGERTTGVASGYGMGTGALETLAFQNASAVPSDGFILSAASGTITGYCLVWGLSQ